MNISYNNGNFIVNLDGSELAINGDMYPESRIRLFMEDTADVNVPVEILGENIEGKYKNLVLLQYSDGDKKVTLKSFIKKFFKKNSNIIFIVPIDRSMIFNLEVLNTGIGNVKVISVKRRCSGGNYSIVSEIVTLNNIYKEGE